MEYITAQEAARKWGISVRLVQKYCAGGRIRGVVKFGQSWGCLYTDLDVYKRQARLPLEKNIVFFTTMEEAIEKGYRPCKRCKPKLVNQSQEGK